jgi:hypothetical protein
MPAHTLKTLVFGIFSGTVLTACVNLGPSALDKDQLAYGNSVGENWKNQMLADLVKMRYVDMPVFLDVGQIVGGYTLETQIDGRLGFSDGLIGGDTQNIGATGRYTDRPTITYMPRTGEDYLRSLLEPVKPSAALALVLAGYSPDFIELVGLITDLPNAGAIGFELEHDPQTRHDVLFMFTEREVDQRAQAERQRVREILGLDPDRKTFRVLYSPFAMEEDVLAIQTRSILQTLMSLANFVEVPLDQARRAAPGYDLPPGADRPFHVRVSSERPEDAYAAYRYEGYWYWIDHTDLRSKEVFTLMLFLTTLTNRSGMENAPVLTIPTS